MREFVRNESEPVFKVFILLCPRGEKRKIRLRVSSFVCRMKQNLLRKINHTNFVAATPYLVGSNFVNLSASMTTNVVQFIKH
jgi:hypothetical protein